MTEEKLSKKVNILVIGDWIIDEDWVMMVDKSVTAAKQMQEKHYHTVFNKNDMATNRLCGVSLTASAIRAFFQKKELSRSENGFPKNIQCDLYGIGVWHPEDNEYIEQLFLNASSQKLNPFRISTPPINEEDKITKHERRLFNLAKDGDKCATMRIVRTFAEDNSKRLPEPMSRYDWNIKWEPNLTKANKKLHTIIDNRIGSIFDEMGTIKFDVIVLADFNKGLISEDLIKSLVGKLKDRENDDSLWFYRSKLPQQPVWQQTLDSHILSKNSTLIKFVDPRMTVNHTEGIPIICGTQLTGDGSVFINKILHPQLNIKKKLAILMNDNSVVAYDSEANNSWVIKSQENTDYLTRGRSSIFLASLVIMELLNKYKDTLQINSFGDNCSIAIANGVKWCKDCKKIWQKKNSDVVGVSADIEQAIEYYEHKSGIGGIVEVYEQGNLDNMSKEWEASEDLENTCCVEMLVNGEKEYQLQVWRAHTLMDKFTLLDIDRKELVLYI